MPDAIEVGDELLVSWREPHRVYHGPQHLREALTALDTLVEARPEPSVADVRAATLAIWFHDAVYDIEAELAGGAP